MAKLTLQEVTNGFNSAPTLNANSTATEEAMEKTLSRDGTSPNDMEVDLDMGGHRVTNIAAPTEPSDAVRLSDVQDLTAVTTLPWDNVTAKPATITQVATLVDPNADRLLFWDDSASALTYLTLGTGLEIVGTTINATAVGGGGVNPDTPPTVPDAADDEFNGSSLDAKWTWENQNSSTTSFGKGIMTMAHPGAASGQVHSRIYQAISGSGRWRVKASCFCPGTVVCGIGFWNTANTRNVVIGFQGGSTANLRVTNWTASSFSSNVVSATDVNGRVPCYYEIETNGTNLFFRRSFTGGDGSFELVSSPTIASFITNAPNQIFLYINHQNVNTPVSYSVDWFRRMA